MSVTLLPAPTNDTPSRVWPLLWFALAIGLFVPPVLADEPAQTPTPVLSTNPSTNPPTNVPETMPDSAGPTDELLESTRRTVRSTTVWLARGVDSWFGNKPFEEGGKVSDGRLSLGLLQRQDQGSDVKVRFNVHVRLPNAEKFAYLFIGRDDARDVVADAPDNFSRQQRLLRDRSDSTAFIAGLGVSPLRALDFRLGFRGGLKPYAQARYQRDWSWDTGSLVDFRQTFFWARDERFGSTTALSLEQALSSALALRWLSATTITQATPKFGWSSSLGAYRSMAQERLLSLELLFNGQQGSGVAVSDYGVQLKWEQPLYRRWLRIEWLGGQFWPRPDARSDRGRAWALGATLKMQF